MMSPKKQLAIRASDLTMRQLAELTQALGASQTEILTLAIDRLYQAEIAQSMYYMADCPGCGAKVKTLKSMPTGDGKALLCPDCAGK